MTDRTKKKSINLGQCLVFPPNNKLQITCDLKVPLKRKRKRKVFTERGKRPTEEYRGGGLSSKTRGWL